MERRLAAILAADVVGFSRLMEADEAGTMVTLKSRRKNVLDPLVAKHKGRIFKTTGDGVLVEFASAVNAVQCAVDLQQSFASANAELPDDRQIVLRIGVNLGDIMVEGGDLYGDGVNIAARLETIAEPGGVLVSGTAQEHVGTKIKIEFEDMGPQTLKNIAQPVRAYRVAGTPAVAAAPIKPGSDKPAIAVLPFANMSGDPDQEFFADGITEDITSALSRISGLLVIARTSTFTYKGKSVDVKRISKELDVRYLMEGSVRRSGDHLRVTAQLIDAETGHHVWAERYDRPMAELFDIQDEITRSVAASTETQVLMAEGMTATSRLSTDSKARDLVAKAHANFLLQSQDSLEEVSRLVEEAIHIDPTLPRAHQLRAWVFLQRMWFGEIGRDAANAAQALKLARMALRLALRDEWSHFLIAEAYLLAGRLEEALAEAEVGLAINPNFSGLLDNLGACYAYLGRSQEAIEACRLALRLDPRNPANFWWRYHITVAHFVVGDYAVSLEQSKREACLRPFLRCGIIWAASAAALDKAEEARTAVEYCLGQRSDLRVGNVVPDFMTRFRRDEDHERLLMFLRKAGLPE